MAVVEETTAAEAEKEKVSPIFEAAVNGDIEAVESALSADASCAKAVNDSGRSALSLAAAKGHAKVVKTLLDAGAIDTAVVGWTAVHHATFGGHAEVLAALAAKLPQAAFTPSEGMPPLLLAATKGSVACLTQLLDAAPSAVNTAVDAHGRTALMCAASGGSVAAVELLVARGAAINATSFCGKTALMWAVMSHRLATVEALARLGADVSIAAPLPDVIVPGQDRAKGETAQDMADSRNGKCPTLRIIGKFLKEWTERQEAAEPGADPASLVPALPEKPWEAHAEAMKRKEEAEAAAKALEADEPNIEELEMTDGAAAAPVADENDIFGADADPAPVPVGSAPPAEEKAVAEEPVVRAVSANADLDELD